MNRRRWIQKSAVNTAGLALASYAPYLIYEKRPKLVNEEEYLRLHWNENPYGPSTQAIHAAQKALSQVNHYPDDNIELLAKALAGKYHVERSQIMITAGSTEMLSLLGQKVGLQQGELLMSESSFPTMAIFGESCGARIRTVPISQKNQIDLDGLLEAINEDTTLIFICNPNNPTSTDHDKSDLVNFIRAVPDDIAVCVDEAYIQYSRHGEKGSVVDQLPTQKNLIVCRTFSKAYGLAGMRLGYAIGHPELLNELRRRHLGFGMANSLVGAAAAKAALEDDAHIEMVIRKNEIGRNILYSAFDKWGVKYMPSATNFTYILSSDFVPGIRAKLKEHKILITQWPSMTDHIRISIGRPEWMEEFVHVAEQYVI